MTNIEHGDQIGLKTYFGHNLAAHRLGPNLVYKPDDVVLEWDMGRVHYRLEHTHGEPDKVVNGIPVSVNATPRQAMSEDDITIENSAFRSYQRRLGDLISDEVRFKPIEPDSKTKFSKSCVQITELFYYGGFVDVNGSSLVVGFPEVSEALPGRLGSEGEMIVNCTVNTACRVLGKEPAEYGLPPRARGTLIFPGTVHYLGYISDEKTGPSFKIFSGAPREVEMDGLERSLSRYVLKYSDLLSNNLGPNLASQYVKTTIVDIVRAMGVGKLN